MVKGVPWKKQMHPATSKRFVNIEEGHCRRRACPAPTKIPVVTQTCQNRIRTYLHMRRAKSYTLAHWQISIPKGRLRDCGEALAHWQISKLAHYPYFYTKLQRVHHLHFSHSVLRCNAALSCAISSQSESLDGWTSALARKVKGCSSGGSSGSLVSLCILGRV